LTWHSCGITILWSRDFYRPKCFQNKNCQCVRANSSTVSFDLCAESDVDCHCVPDQPICPYATSHPNCTKHDQPLCAYGKCYCYGCGWLEGKHNEDWGTTAAGYYYYYYYYYYYFSPSVL